MPAACTRWIYCAQTNLTLNYTTSARFSLYLKHRLQCDSNLVPIGLGVFASSSTAAESSQMPVHNVYLLIRIPHNDFWLRNTYVIVLYEGIALKAAIMNNQKRVSTIRKLPVTRS